MMNRRDFLKTTGLGLAAMTCPPWRSPAAETTATNAIASTSAGAGKPNIIFILSDDVGLGDIGCCGSDHFKTPHIDALAQSGLRFEYNYAMPLCGPSRCLALTGRYPFRTGLINNQSHNAISPSREIMMPTVMKKAGYITAQAGKWGQMCLGPGEWGFDEYLVFPGSGRYWRDQTAHYTLNGERKPLPEGKYLPDLMHHFVVNFIERHQARPFYLYYAMSHIHGPIVRTPDSQPGSDLYADNIAYMDKLVGQLVGALDRLKLREKTLIVFAGDNGTARFGANRSSLGGRKIHGMKATILEGGSRVPLIANWPGTTPAGKVNRDLTDFSDFFTTFAALGGAKLPEGVKLDGHSFVPQLKGLKGDPREWVYVELNGKSYVRNARFKLTNGGELFDMQEAPFNEILIPRDTTDADALAARRRLQEILDQHPAAPAGADARGKRKQAKKKQQQTP